RLLPVRPHVYGLPGMANTWHRLLLAAVLGAGDGAVGSHGAAAALHHIPGFPEGPLDVTLPRGATPVAAGATVHESLCLPPSHSKVVQGIPVTSVARTIFDLCGRVHPLRAERALDNCLSRQMVTVPALWRVHGDLAEHGRAGTVLLRELLLGRGNGYVAPASELEA